MEDHAKRLKLLKKRFLNIEASYTKPKNFNHSGIKSMRISPESKEKASRSFNQLEPESSILLDYKERTKAKRIKTNNDDSLAYNRKLKEIKLPKLQPNNIEGKYIDSMRERLNSLKKMYDTEISEILKQKKLLSLENESLGRVIEELKNKIFSLQTLNQTHSVSIQADIRKETRDFGVNFNYEVYQYPCYEDLKRRCTELEAEIETLNREEKENDLMNLSLTILPKSTNEKECQASFFETQKLAFKDDEPEISLMTSTRATKETGLTIERFPVSKARKRFSLHSNIEHHPHLIIQSHKEVYRGDSRLIAPSISFTQSNTDFVNHDYQGIGLLFFGQEISLKLQILIKLYIHLNFKIEFVKYPCELANLNDKKGVFLLVELEQSEIKIPEILSHADFLLNFSKIHFDIASQSQFINLQEPFIEIYESLSFKNSIMRNELKLNIVLAKDSDLEEYKLLKSSLKFDSESQVVNVIEKLFNNKNRILHWKPDFDSILNFFGAFFQVFISKITIFHSDTNIKIPFLDTQPLKNIRYQKNNGIPNNLPDIIFIFGDSQIFHESFLSLYNEYSYVNIEELSSVIHSQSLNFLNKELNSDFLFLLIKKLFGSNLQNNNKKYLLKIPHLEISLLDTLHFLSNHGISFKIVTFGLENSLLLQHLQNVHKAILTPVLSSQQEVANLMLKL